jgi:hypothetical protein
MRVNGIDLQPFTPMQRSIVLAVAHRAPALVTTSKLIEAIYPDPDKEPDWARACIHTQTWCIRKKWTDPHWRLKARKGPGGGYYLEGVHAGN